MARLACVDVADLPLQLLFKKHPGWRGVPAAVVSKDSPYGTIRSANAQAKEYGITPGLSHAAALSLNHELRADVIPAETIKEGSDFLAAKLRKLSARVEVCEPEPGVYWLDAGGMALLFPELKSWCGTIRDSLEKEGFTARIAAGFSRFGCYAAAKSIEDQAVFPHPRSERECALAAGIHVLNLPPGALDRLEMLGIRTVGAFLRLPPGGVGKRFGPEVERLYRFASGDLDLPLQPAEVQEEPLYVQNLPHAEISSERLLGFLGRVLEELAAEVRKRHRLIRELRICFVLEGEEVLLEPILPSVPSTDPELLEDLVALRLENRRLPGAAAAIRVSASTVAERNIQEELFSCSSTECLKEVEKVFSRLRATFGNGCIQRARLEDEHMPEHTFRWEDLGRLPGHPETARGSIAAPGSQEGEQAGHGKQEGVLEMQGRQAVQGRRAVRRIFPTPCAAPSSRFEKLWGPYLLSGRWWLGEQPREYCYAETREGRILWLRFDRAEGRWRQIGVVE